METLLAVAANHPTAVIISAIVGVAGVGKSALAIHAAHRFAHRFPDGQLYLDLQGAAGDPPPLEPQEALGRFLRALGVAGDAIPSGLAEAAALFRSTVAGRSLLIVLDNARDAAQVTALLPGTADCGVLVTSRRNLTSLPAACHLQLDVLSEPEAVVLLARLAGDERVDAEPAAAAQVARWCGHLPLALRIAGARLAARPGWRIQTMADRLADAGRRLDELELPELGVRASLTVSHAELAASDDPVDRAAAAAFPLLGLPDGPDLALAAAARLLDRPVPVTERLLERLVDANLLQSPTAGRYRLHDLIRLTAAEHAAAHLPPEHRTAALTRLFTLYTATTWHAATLLRTASSRLRRADPRYTTGGLPLADIDTALAWLEAARPNLIAAVHQATTTPGVDHAIGTQLAHAMFEFLHLRSYWDDVVQVNQIVLTTARHVGQAARALAGSDVAAVRWRQGRHAEAVARLTESLIRFRELRDRHGQATSLNNLSLLHRAQGEMGRAREYAQESLAIHQEMGDRRGQAISLTNLGICLRYEGRHEEELACAKESLKITRALGGWSLQAIAHSNLGVGHQMLGNRDRAIAHIQESMAIHRRLGNRNGQADTLADLSQVYRHEGHNTEALASLREALAIHQELHNHNGQAVTHRELGNILHSIGQVDWARAHWGEALAIFERLQSPAADEVRRMLDDLAPDPIPSPPTETPTGTPSGCC